MLYSLSCRNKCTKFINSIWWQTIPPITKQLVFWIIFILSIISATIPFILNWNMLSNLFCYPNILSKGSDRFSLISWIPSYSNKN